MSDNSLRPTPAIYIEPPGPQFAGMPYALIGLAIGFEIVQDLLVCHNRSSFWTKRPTTRDPHGGGLSISDMIESTGHHSVQAMSGTILSNEVDVFVFPINPRGST